MKTDFLHLNDFSESELISLMDSADALRLAWTENRMPRNLHNKNVALIWEAGGFRNRVAFELGIAAMGGKAIQVPGKLDARELIQDIVRYLGNWFHAIVARTETHEQMIRLARAATIPVINARTNHNHPCEVLADLTYIRAKRGSIDDLKVVFVGEPTNLCYPWFEAAAKLPISVIQVCPKGYEMDSAHVDAFSRGAKGEVGVSNSLERDLAGADVIYTDCWPSRLTEKDAARIGHDFASYQVTSEKLHLAKQGFFFLPCPPVTRGEEVSEEVMQTWGAAVYEAKEYLLHAQNAILSFVL